MKDLSKKPVKPVGGSWEDIEYEAEEKPLSSFDDDYWRVLRSEGEVVFNLKDSIVFNQKQEAVEVVEKIEEFIEETYVEQPTVETTPYQPFIKTETHLKQATSLVNFPEFFKTASREVKTAFSWLGELWTNYFMAKNTKEKPQDPEKLEAEKEKALKKKNKLGFIQDLKSMGAGMRVEHQNLLSKKAEDLNKLINQENLSYKGHLNASGQETEYARTLAERKNSELSEKEMKAKKEASIAQVSKKTNLLNLNAQEGNSMVANQIMTAG